MAEDEKELRFWGASYNELMAFPRTVIQDVGYQLGRIQQGREPNDWKWMQSIGAGVQEISLWDASGTFRVIYVVKFEDAIYVLRCFQKKSQKTPDTEINLAKARLSDLIKELRK